MSNKSQLFVGTCRYNVEFVHVCVHVYIHLQCMCLCTVHSNPFRVQCALFRKEMTLADQHWSTTLQGQSFYHSLSSLTQILVPSFSSSSHPSLSSPPHPLPLLLLPTIIHRTVSIQLREDHCCFLRVERDEYRRILLSVEKNTVKIKEQGKDVMLLERATGGRQVCSMVVQGSAQNNPRCGRSVTVKSFLCDYCLQLLRMSSCIAKHGG